MANDKIKSSDIFEGEIFKKIKGDADEFKQTLVALKGEFEKILGQQRDFLSKKQGYNEASDINKTNQAIDRSTKARVGLSAVQKQLTMLQDEEVKGKIRFNEANKRQRKELAALIKLEQAQGVTLETLKAKNSLLRQERERLNINTAKGKKRIDEINKALDKNNKLIAKNADAMKKQRLNVGNYTSAIKGAVGKLRNLAGAFGLVAGAAGVVSVFRNAIGIIRDFEQVQTDLASILQKTRFETEALTQAAQDLGATTFFTATEVSKLQVELAKLGFDTQQILDSEEAILDLAAAFSIDLAQAAKVVASTLNGFQLDASESGRVADVLAKSFAKSALDIEKFEVAISKVAPIAAGLGIDIETTTASLGKLVSAGFDASTAGTQFRNILLKLSNPASELANTLGFTVENSDDLIKSFKTLNKEQLSIAEAQGLIDVRSVALLKSLSDNSDGVQELRSQLEGAGGTAKDIASKQLQTLNGSFRLLESAYRGFILEVDKGDGSISQLVKSISQLITGVFNLLTDTDKTRESFAALNPEIQELATTIVNFFKAVKSAVTTLFEYRRVIIATVVALKSYQAILALTTLGVSLYQKATVLARIATIAFSGGLKGATRAMKLLNISIRNNPIGLLASALAILGSVLLTYVADWIFFGESTDDVNDKLEDSADKIENVEKRVKSLKAELANFASIRNIFDNVLKGNIDVLLKATSPELSKALSDANKRLEETVRSLRVQQNNLANDLDGKYTESIKNNIKSLAGQEAVIRRIIGAIEDEQAARKAALEIGEDETGILNRLRADLKKVREARDAALTKEDIEKNNLLADSISKQIKELENLGLTADETAKKLTKIRTALDKLLIKSANDIDKAFSDIEGSEFSKEIRGIENELESFNDKLKAVDETLSDEEFYLNSKGSGFFFRRLVTSREDLESLLDDSRLFTEESIRLIELESQKKQEALEKEFEREDKDAVSRRKLRDKDYKKRQDEIDLLYENQKISKEDYQADSDKVNELLLASDVQLKAEQGALEKKFREDEAKLEKESQDEKTKLTIAGEERREAARNKYFDTLRDKYLEEIDEFGNYVNKVIELTEKKVAEQNRLESERIQRDVDSQERASEVQFDRAKKGLDNTYKFQEERAAQARQAQLEAERKAQQEEKALRLVSIYFAALQARLAEAANNETLKSKGKTVGLGQVTSATAPLFAIKDTFLAEAASSAIAGAFATGVENFQGKGTGTSDSNLIAFSHGESVVTAKGTAENAGLTTAMNNGTVDEYFAKVWMPKFDMDNSFSTFGKTKPKDNTNYMLLNEIKALRSEAASRPVQQVHVDSFGNIIETSYRDGLKTVINHKAKKRI